MATQLRIKRRTADANAPAGLTAGEMAINLFDKKLYVGGTAGTNIIFLDSTSSVGLSTANTFTQLNTFSAGISASGATFGNAGIKVGENSTRFLTITSDGANSSITQNGNSTLSINHSSYNSIYIGDSDVANNGTYIEVADGAALIALNANEIQINGPISTPLVLANAESIQNTTNGRIDFMPGPTAAGAYGLYADVANWGYGIKMGTINSAGTIDSSPGGILFMDAVSVVQDKFLNIGSDGGHALVLATQNGLDTLQIAVSPGAANSQAVAITGRNDAGTTNRSPVTSHINPNLYIYRAGITSANDFIRIEHDGTNGNIVAGGTSGIKISGLLDVASGLSAAGATFNGTVNIGTTALISAPSATALAIRSQIPAGTGVTPTIQIICPSAAYTLTNQIATQKVFDLPQDTITLQAATTYMFEGQYLLTTGTTTHITSMSFVLTTATMTNCSWTSTTGMPTALNAATSGSFHAIFNSVAGGNVNTTSASANTMITFKGIMRVDVGGTMVPNIAFSAQPGGTNTVLIGSYLKFYPIGANTINSVGTAIG